MSSQMLSAFVAVIVLGASLSTPAAGRELLTFKKKSNTPAIFIFGDSTTDAGNNNYISNPIYSAKKKPNGKDFKPQSGRFTNGKLIVDYLCDNLGLPYAPPFLQPNADFSSGINFASGGAGVLNATRAGRTIPFYTQLDAFNVVYANPAGYGLSLDDIENSLVYISISANDYIVYITSPELQATISFDDYKQQVVNGIIVALKTLYSKGLRKFVVQGIPALGCTPAIGLAFDAQNRARCVPYVQQIMEAHNTALQASLNQFIMGVPAIRLSFSLAFFKVQLDASQYPFLYGFLDGTNACCGAGKYGGAVACGEYDVVDGKNVTTNTCLLSGSNVYWDYFHPSSRAYKIMADAMWSGCAPYISPYNIKDLVRGMIL